MKKLFVGILIAMLILGLPFQNKHVYANSLDDYLNIKLTSPIKSKNIVRLYSEDGFYVYIDNIFNEIEYIEVESIYVVLGPTGEIEIRDDIDNILFSTYESNLILSSSNKWDSIIKVEDKHYRDYIKFINKQEELLVLNYIELNHYLYGLVPREMPASFPMEALKAQAIAARTYALKNINKHINDGYNLCDTTHCQVYGGMDGEQERTNEAVDDTKGLVITYNGEIIDALYHSTSGGHTEDSVEAWGNYLPYLIGVEDDFSKGTPNSDWSFTIKSSELNNRLKNSGIHIGDVIDMEVVGTTPKGRVSNLKVIGTYGEKILNKSQIRQVLGNDQLKSTWFTIKTNGDSTSRNDVYVIDDYNEKPQKIDLSKAHILDGNFNKRPSRGINNRALGRDKTIQLEDSYEETADSFLIQGKGYGHGVGMSQWGAKKMAEEGYSFDSILKHYYTGVEITIKN